MTEERYPTDLEISAQDFHECGWKEALESVTEVGYLRMRPALSEVAKEKIETGEMAEGKVLWLLADACSMILKPESINEPFKPWIQLEDRRGVIPGDFTDEDIEFLAKIVDDIDDPWLKARVADLVWLRLQPRDVKFALAAIDSYRLIPLDAHTWNRGGRECWERAIRLCYMIRSGAGQRLDDIESEIVRVLDSVTHEEGFFGPQLARLLQENNLGKNVDSKIATKLENLGNDFNNDERFREARECFGSAANWYKSAGDKTKSIEMTIAAAEGWVSEAEVNAASGAPRHTTAADCYEKAIQTLRGIPGKDRPPYKVDERIEQLRKRQREAGKRSTDEMMTISSDGVDVTELVEEVRKAVRGRKPLDALWALVRIHPYPKAADYRARAKEKLAESPLRSLTSSATLSRDGRVMAKRSGSNAADERPEDNEEAIHECMLQDFGVLLQLVVPAYIWPAHQELLLEHRFALADFVNLAKQSPIVLVGREYLFGKGLYAGYETDFRTALHLLTPQIENLVRSYLNRADVITTTLDTDGIEMEKGLSALMKFPEAIDVCGENLAFEIKSLFCDPRGPNLRNEFAHGQLDDRTSQSYGPVYAWWFTLRLVFNSFWISTQHADEPTDEDE